MANSTKGPLYHDDGAGPAAAPVSLGLDLSDFPTIFVLPIHIALSNLHDIEHQLAHSGASLTYDIREANLILGNISKPRRAKFELHAANLHFKDVDPITQSENSANPDLVLGRLEEEVPPRKRPKLELSETQSTTDESRIFEPQNHNSTICSETEADSDADSDADAEPISQLSISQAPSSITVDSSPPPEAPPVPHVQAYPTEHVQVISIAWLEDSSRLGIAQDPRKYLIYEAELLPHGATSPSSERPSATPDPKKSSTTANQGPPPEPREPKGILERARAEAESKPKPKTSYFKASKRDRISDAAKRDFTGRSFTSSTSQGPIPQPPLLHQSTSEYEEGASVSLPPLPSWVLENKIYSCQRATPPTSPNDAFIAQLKEIRLARLLTNDEIGVRAYSTSIASLAAYPYTIQHTNEILALPGCDSKIAHLFREWQESPDHRIQAVKDIENDPTLKCLCLFYEIWGVGAITAREFYYDRQWRDLDDIIEFGWNTLSRVQQIGVKYYDEFLLKIPRLEVEAIADIVARHAKQVVDERIECVIVGGYRRGKPESGDVDLILSHPDQSATAGLVNKVVRSLEKEGWITHTLILNLTNTKRGQETLPYFSNTKGAGFDTLDKALVVWQDQAFPGKGEINGQGGKPNKNPNPHRRVDIIISPWRTVGCAVAGWTSGTTFQRDLRRYAKKVKGWKFDSSGMRERGTGKWIDLEGWTDPKTRCKSWEEAERRVFEGMELEYREPWDRCTG